MHGNDWRGQYLLDYVVGQARSGQCRVRSHNLEIDCPSCHGYRKFSIHAIRGAYGCFTCSISGTLLPLLVENRLRWVPVRDLVRGRQERAGGDLSAATGTARRAVSLPFYPIGGDVGSSPPPAEPRKPFPSAVEGALSYCLGRGMTMGQIREYRVGILTMVPRVYFPYWEDGETTYWMGRAIHAETQPKTLEPGDQSLKPLFGRHVNSWNGNGPLLLVEGVFDHFATPNSYAMMGSFLSNRQLDEIIKLQPSWVALLLDPDAIEKSQQICKRLWSRGIRAASIRWAGTQKDPGDLGFEVMSGVQRLLSGLPVPVRPGVLRVRV